MEILSRLTRRKRLFVLFLASLALRLAFALPVAWFDVPAVGDESGYLMRAEGYRALISDSLAGRPTSQAELARAYGHGRRPPLYPVFLALVFLVFPAVPAVRLISTVISALTTPLVYQTTKQISTPRAALIAALMHLGFPRFVAFSHLLWSETLYLFLIVLSLHLTLRTLAARRERRMGLLAVATGVVLGLGGLTRPTILPFLLLVPGWVALRVSVHLRVVMPTLVVAGWLAVLLPWEVVLYQQEHRVVLLSKNDRLGLYIGSRPGTTAQEIEGRSVLAAVGDEIRRDPIGFARRALNRPLLSVWRIDPLVRRHVLRAVYPPLPPVLVAAWLGLAIVSNLLLVWGAIWGFVLRVPIRGDPARLILLLIMSNLAVVSLTTANGRYNMPNLVLMLPMFGHGLAHFGQLRGGKRAHVAVGFCLLLSISMLSTMGHDTRASSIYAPLLSRLPGFKKVRAFDHIEFRATGAGREKTVTVRTLEPDYRMQTAGDLRTRWEFATSEVRGSFRLVSCNARAPAALELESDAGERETLVPVRSVAWRRWQPTGLDGVEYRWHPTLEKPRCHRQRPVAGESAPGKP